MKISELIAELLLIQENYGDCEAKVVERGGIFSAGDSCSELGTLAIGGITKDPFVLVIPAEPTKEAE